MKSAPIDTASAATADIVAAPGAGKFIRVHGYALTASGATEFRLKDGAGTVLGGLASPANGNAVGMGLDKEGYFDLPDDSALQGTNSAAVRVIGHVSYSIRGDVY